MTNTHGGSRQNAGRKPLSPKLRALTVRIHPVAADWLIRLSRVSGHSQAKIVEHLILEAGDLPDELNTKR